MNADRLWPRNEDDGAAVNMHVDLSEVCTPSTRALALVNTTACYAAVYADAGRLAQTIVHRHGRNVRVVYVVPLRAAVQCTAVNYGELSIMRGVGGDALMPARLVVWRLPAPDHALVMCKCPGGDDCLEYGELATAVARALDVAGAGHARSVIDTFMAAIYEMEPRTYVAEVTLAVLRARAFANEIALRKETTP